MNICVQSLWFHRVKIARVIRVSASIKATTNLGLIEAKILGAI